MDLSTESGIITSNEIITNVTQQDAAANSAWKNVNQPESYWSDPRESAKNSLNDNNSKHVVTRPAISVKSKNDLIDQGIRNLLSRKTSSLAQFAVVTRENMSELADGSDERYFLVEVTEDIGTRADSFDENQGNTAAHANNSVVSEVNLEKSATSATVPENCENRELVTQQIQLHVCQSDSSKKTDVCVELCPEDSSTPMSIEEHNERQSVETVLPQKLNSCTFCYCPNLSKKATLIWETMQFCCLDCLSRYQIQIGSFCFYCCCLVKLPCMGKYAVRMGVRIRQFCSGLCLERAKKRNKSCSFCQVNLTNEESIIRIPILKGKSLFQVFCSKACYEDFKLLRSGSKIPPSGARCFCTVCAGMKQVEIQVIQDSDIISLCSDLCFKTYKFANNMDDIRRCYVCNKFFPPGQPNSLLPYHNGILLDFCGEICHNVFLSKKRKLVSCCWCKVVKFDHDMIQQSSTPRVLGGQCVIVCSINCLTLYQVSLKPSSEHRLKCDLCSKFASAQFNLIMPNSSTRHFCSRECLTTYPSRNYKSDSVPRASEFSTASGNPVVVPSASPTLEPSVPSRESSPIITNLSEESQSGLPLKESSPIITNLSEESQSSVPLKESSPVITNPSEESTHKAKYTQQILLKPPEPKDSANKFVLCKPSTNNGASQTDEFLKYPPVLPIPVPVYVPYPIPMYGYLPIPVPVPVTQPCPVPVLISTPEKTYQSIMVPKKITPDSSNGSTMTNQTLPVFREHEFENITSESDEDVNMHPIGGESVESSSLNYEKFPQTEESVFTKALNEMLQINQKSKNERPIRNPVVDCEAKIGPGIQMKDGAGKVDRVVEMVTSEEISEIRRTNRKTENKRATQDSFVEVKAKSVSISLGRRTNVGDNDSKVVPIAVLHKKDYNSKLKILQNLGKIMESLKAESASHVMRSETRLKIKGKNVPQNAKLRGVRNSDAVATSTTTTRNSNEKNETQNPVAEFKIKSAGTQQKNTGAKVSQTAELSSSVHKVRKTANEEASQNPLIKFTEEALIGHGPQAQRKDTGAKVSYTAQLGSSDIIRVRKTANKEASQNPVIKITKAASIGRGPQTQIQEGSSCNPFKAHAGKLLSGKRTLDSAEDPSNSKRSRSEHVTSANYENDHSPKLRLSNSVSSSPLLDPEPASADPPLFSKVIDGLNVWKQWLSILNMKIKKSARLENKKPKLFSTNILNLTISELNYLLCKFVKEIRQPNGAEYAPDSIYHLCLCIQCYLFENGCINNIFVDNLYQPFINALDEVVRKFASIKDSSQHSLTGVVEEELLWECEQLGGHSPHVLLATLLFFNTKFFKLSTLEEHMRISFTNIVRMKMKNSNVSSSSNKTVTLRFYPSTTTSGARKSQKKPYYEVHEDEENLLRCPVRLYEFYLSKCRGSVKQRNDVFYLQPDGSCLLDSPVWFTKTPLPRDILAKMLHRIQMVKEMNI